MVPPPSACNGATDSPFVCLFVSIDSQMVPQLQACHACDCYRFLGRSLLLGFEEKGRDVAENPEHHLYCAVVSEGKKVFSSLSRTGRGGLRLAKLLCAVSLLLGECARVNTPRIYPKIAQITRSLSGKIIQAPPIPTRTH